MKNIIYPNQLQQSTQEKLTSKIIHDYWHWIKLHFLFPSKHNLKGIKYCNYNGWSIDIFYQSFSFRIYSNFKIKINIINKEISEYIIEKRLNEIINIIEKYYPEIYNNIK